MGVITRMRQQDAVYWPKGAVDKYGKATLGTPVAVKVRWDDVHEKFLNGEGDEVISNAVVYVPEVSAGVEMKTGDYLWLGLLANIPASPLDDPNVYEIRRFEKSPNMKATEFLRTAML